MTAPAVTSMAVVRSSDAATDQPSEAGTGAAWCASTGACISPAPTGTAREVTAEAVTA